MKSAAVTALAPTPFTPTSKIEPSPSISTVRVGPRSDRHQVAEVAGVDAGERGDVDPVLPTRQVGVETVDGVVAKVRRELEDVVAEPAVHGVVAQATSQPVVAGDGADDIVATLTVDHVDAGGLQRDGVVALAADDVLDRVKGVDARLWGCWPLST